jgi:hypothetical protein
MDESSMFPGFGRPDDHDRTEKRTRGTRTKRRTGEAKACAETAASPAAPSAAIAVRTFSGSGRSMATTPAHP